MSVPHATIYPPHTNQTIVVEKNLEGKFICHCTNKGCPKPSKFADNLRSHIVKAGSRWNGPGIKGDPILEQFDLGPGTAMAAGPSRAKMDLTHDKGLTPGTSRVVHAFDTIPGEEVEPSPSRASMDLAQESDSDIDQSSEHSTGTSTSEEDTPSNPMPPQDEIMCSPTPTKPSTTPTVTPQAASPSMWSNMLTDDDVNMGSPMSDKSAPLQQLQPPLPSLLSVMQSHSTSTTQASQLPSTSTTGTTPASHTNGLLHHTYLDSLNLAVNAEFHFLTCQICQAALAPGEVKHHLTKLHGTQSRYNDHEFNLAISAFRVAKELPPHIPGPRTIVHGLKVHNGWHAVNPPAWWPCKIQQLRKGAGDVQTFWEVQNVEADSQPTLHQSLVDSLLKELEPTLQVIQTPLDGCMVSPWLLTTQWHEQVAGKDIKQLCSLVALPKNDDGDIPGLKDLVEAYYEEAIPLLDRTGELRLLVALIEWMYEKEIAYFHQAQMAWQDATNKCEKADAEKQIEKYSTKLSEHAVWLVEFFDLDKLEKEQKRSVALLHLSANTQHPEKLDSDTEKLKNVLHLLCGKSDAEVNQVYDTIAKSWINSKDSNSVQPAFILSNCDLAKLFSQIFAYSTFEDSKLLSVSLIYDNLNPYFTRLFLAIFKPMLSILEFLASPYQMPTLETACANILGSRGASDVLSDTDHQHLLEHMYRDSHMALQDPQCTPMVTVLETFDPDTLLTTWNNIFSEKLSPYMHLFGTSEPEEHETYQ
ncbi:hypothetical protein EDC04DRAFT_2900593 [Pisolithus marmoratus]|nr:hypothetical protein EDC04DRAFT_2900593 [Pisolithus marmoratus]